MENEHVSMPESILINASRVISAVCVPIIIPVITFFALFTFTYLRVMPTAYKLIVLGIVFCFTIMLPVLTIFMYMKINRMLSTGIDPNKQYIPYLLTIISFVFCSMMMYRLNIPWYMNGVILSFILMMIILLVLNIKLSISVHAGGMGFVIGAIISFSGVFGYNPVWLLCAFIILAGMVGSAQIILGRHTLNDVLSGFTVGLVCTVAVLHPMSNLFFRYLLL